MPVLNLRELKPGDKVKLAGDILAEVIWNPRDGMWIRARYLEVPENPDAVGTEDQVFAADVLEKV